MADVEKTRKAKPFYYKLWHWYIPNWIKKFPRWQIFEIKMARQRLKRGWSDRDAWSLDHYLTNIITGGVKRLRDNLHGWPGEPMKFEEWEVILDEIVEGFTLSQQLTNDWKFPTPEEQAKIDKAWDHFRKYYHHLWD